jgi:hypothetical protein
MGGRAQVGHNFLPRILLSLVAMFLAAGCISAGRRGYPLYPSDRALAPHEVAAVAGFVKDIDGQDVSKHGSNFEVLPGCHVIGTPTKWGQMNINAGEMVATGRLVFVLPMQAGHQYFIEVGESTFANGPMWRVIVVARETDAKGSTIRTFAPATSPKDFEACRRETQ